MTTVTFIRHGESVANVFRNRGYVPENIDLYDSPLTDNGRNQCKNAQKFVDTMSFDTIFVSPLVRACETAAIIFENKENKLHIKRCCREIQHNSPECQGRLMHDLIHGTYGEIQNYRPALKNMPGGLQKFQNLEKIEHWTHRWNVGNTNEHSANAKNIEKLLRLIFKCKNTHICIVCHGSVIKTVTNMNVHNCGILQCKFDSSQEGIHVEKQFYLQSSFTT